MSCAICTKYVALPEQRRACNKTYHADCFKCGGSNDDGCKKKLTLDGYQDSKGEPYCKTCYGKLFGPKGFMGGTVNFNSFDVDTAESDRLVNDRHYKVTDNKSLPTAGKVSSTATAFIPNTANAKHCPKCSKIVTLAEERIACKQSWHIDCFTCGGVEHDGCNKRLTLDAYTAHGDNPYCRPCYQKNFGTKGFMGGSVTMNNYVPGGNQPDHYVNNRNESAAAHDILPAAGSVKAALQNLKKELPNA